MIRIYLAMFRFQQRTYDIWFVPYRLMELTDCPGAYSVTQGPKLVETIGLTYNLSSLSSILVAPTLMAHGEFPGEYLQASSK